MNDLHDIPTLDDAAIDRLVAALRQQGAPIAAHLSPGLSDDEMQTLVAPLDIVLPAEARAWWRYANGVPSDAPGSGALSPSWSWAGLEDIVAECIWRRESGREGALPGLPSLFDAAWLPIVIGDGMLVIDTSQDVTAAVYNVDWHDDDLTEPYAGAAFNRRAGTGVDDRSRTSRDLVRRG